MSFDTHSILAYSTVSSITSQSAGTLILSVQSGDGAKFAVLQQVTIWPSGVQPILANAMVCRITAISTDQLTIDYNTVNKEGTNTRVVLFGDQIANTETAKVFTDIESAEVSTKFATSQVFKRGTALSGLEFGSVYPGIVGTDYFQPSLTDFQYLAQKGFDLVRLPFAWERIQPVLNGTLEPNYKSYIDTAIANAKSLGIQLVLDVHNFGERVVVAAGGFSLLTSGSSDVMFSGNYSLSSGVMTIGQFSRVFAGATNNPVSPAVSYIITTDVNITSDGGQSFNALDIEFFHTDDNNKYFVTYSVTGGYMQLYKVIAGVQTQLATVSETFTFNSFNTIVIDVGQTTVNTILVKLNGTQVMSHAIDGAQTTGGIDFWGSGVNFKIQNFTLNVNGDTTSARASSGQFRVGAAGLSTANFANLWSALATAYVNEPAVFMYDLMNEPNSMPVSTSPSNYLTTSSTTLMNQAAINAIRLVDKNKWICIESDQFTGIQSFTSAYGSNPQIWWTDPSNKTMVSWHYYQDSDHSGTYSGAYSATYRTRIPGDINPALQWAAANNIPTYIGEYGVPNGTSSDQKNWQADMDYLLSFFDVYGVLSTQWAAGQQYSAITTLQPTNSYGTDREQIPVLQRHLGYTPFLLRCGTGTLSGGTATITTPLITPSSLVFLTPLSGGAHLGELSVGTITTATSFVVNSSNALDTSVFNWFIVN